MKHKLLVTLIAIAMLSLFATQCQAVFRCPR
jgi:hypothetical protein